MCDGQGVFPKTLRNMWWSVLIFNPVLSFFASCIVPMSDIVNPDLQPVILSKMAAVAGGKIAILRIGNVLGRKSKKKEKNQSKTTVLQKPLFLAAKC